MHEERICQLHFEPSVFINESRNRLHQSAFPTLHLTSECDSTNNDTLINGIPLSLFSVSYSTFTSIIFNYKYLLNLIFFFLIQDHRVLNMSKAELLYHAQMAAANNLTITAVPLLKPKPNMDVINDTFSEPLNLSKPTLNTSHPVIKSPPKNKLQHFTTTIPTETIPVTSIPSPAPSVPPQTNGNSKIVHQTNGTHSSGFRRPRQIFSQEQEDQLAVYVRETSNYYSGLSSKEVRIMAYVYGVCNQVDMPTGWHETHQASFDWCVGFVKRTKLPPTMITGISNKGKSKASHSNSNNNNNEITSLPTPNTTTSPIKATKNVSIVESIEID